MRKRSLAFAADRMHRTGATFPVAICRGGSGKTEITVTASDGKTATFKITCRVTQIGKQYLKRLLQI